MIFTLACLDQSLTKSRSARHVAYDSVRRGWMSVVTLPFNERVIHQES